MVTLTANTLAGLTLISRELLEDAENVDRELANAFARVLALKVDQAALYGGGVAPEPLGVKNTPGVITVPFGGANGGTLTNYDPILDAVGTLHDANESPTGVIYSARTGRELAKTKDTLGQSIVVPNYIADLPRYDTNQVPNTLTAGTASTASDIFTGPSCSSGSGPSFSSPCSTSGTPTPARSGSSPGGGVTSRSPAPRRSTSPPGSSDVRCRHLRPRPAGRQLRAVRVARGPRPRRPTGRPRARDGHPAAPGRANRPRGRRRPPRGSRGPRRPRGSSPDRPPPPAQTLPGRRG